MSGHTTQNPARRMDTPSMNQETRYGQLRDLRTLHG